jgi:hypothetical protein
MAAESKNVTARRSSVAARTPSGVAELNIWSAVAMSTSPATVTVTR